MKEPSQNVFDSETHISNFLELAANDDVEGLKKVVEDNPSIICEVGLWYGRQKGSRQMVLQHRTPLMVASTYASLGVLKLFLSLPNVDVNFSGVQDKTTALHCAASSGSINSDETVKLLLEFGADLNVMDIDGLSPFDVIVVPPTLPSKKASLEYLLSKNGSKPSNSSIIELKLNVTTIGSSGSSSPPLSSSPENGSSTFRSDLVMSPKKKEYPIDPSFPDIKDSIYASDEFRMFSFKVRPCSRAYSHDWTECPFVHPGENARRRDPRKYHYSSFPCPEFKKGACKRGDLCEYAHGVFECWLHPAQYKTKLCKDGINCDRRVCFFAHFPEELRPLYVGSTVQSPRAADMAAAMNLYPGSPSSISAMSPSPFSPPPNNACSNPLWGPHQIVPTLHLPGGNLQSSRLRSSLSARDIPPDDFDRHHHVIDDHMASFSPRSNPSLIRTVRSKPLAPSNLEDRFCSEISSSPRFSDHASGGTFSPTHKSLLLNNFQQQQSLLAPINTSNLYSSSLPLSSPQRMSPQSVEPISPLSARFSSLAPPENHHHLRSLSSREFGPKRASSLVGSPVKSWSNWGSPIEKVDWSLNNNGCDGESRVRRSSFELGNDNGEEPDLSWVNSLVKDSPPEIIEKHDGMETKPSMDSSDHSVIGAWLEQMQLDQLVDQ